METKDEAQLVKIQRTKTSWAVGGSTGEPQRGRGSKRRLELPSSVGKAAGAPGPAAAVSAVSPKGSKVPERRIKLLFITNVMVIIIK